MKIVADILGSKPGFGLVLLAGLVVGACDFSGFTHTNQGYGKKESQYSPHASHDRAAALLSAQGSWHLVEEKQALSPEEQYLQARAQVDPSKKNNKAYTYKGSSANRSEISMRVLRLEKEVAGLRRDFHKLLPPLSDLIVSDARLDRTIHSIRADEKLAAAERRLANLERLKQPVVSSVKKPSKKVAKKVHKVKTGGPLRVGAIRFGHHPGKTRMVLDVTGPVKFSYDLDNNEKLLLIELPSTGWSASTAKTLRRHPLIKGYTAQGNGAGGTTLALELKKPARIVWKTNLTPNKTRGHRVVFDLAAQ